MNEEDLLILYKSKVVFIDQKGSNAERSSSIRSVCLRDRVGRDEIVKKATGNMVEFTATTAAGRLLDMGLNRTAKQCLCRWYVKRGRPTSNGWEKLHFCP